MEYCESSRILFKLSEKRLFALLNPSIQLMEYVKQDKNDIPEIDQLFDLCEIRSDGVRFYYLALGTGTRKRKYHYIYTRTECMNALGAAFVRAKVIRSFTVKHHHTAFVSILIPNHRFFIDPLNLCLDYMYQNKICFIVHRFYSAENDRKNEMDFYPPEFESECLKPKKQ